MAKHQQMEKLQRLLKHGPARTSAILEHLGISQPTFSRLWTTVTDGIVLGAGKARQYALRRHVPGVDAPIPVFRISAQGQAGAIGFIDVLQGGFYVLRVAQGSGYQIFEGIPFFLSDLRPQGFLGRMEPGKNRDLDLPPDILKWTDEHVFQYISRRSEHAAGDLILGNESYARYLSDLGKPPYKLADIDRQNRYPEMATQSMQGDPPGSSAGGEQPKFTALVARSGRPETTEHVILKFSPPLNTPGGRRWGDLLLCEHLALNVLMRNGIAAANTSVLEAGGRMFLEVVRFDRTGLTGRSPIATFFALDGDLGMLDKNWTAFARELGRRGELTEKDVATVEILDLFGALIGNTDRHHGNMAVAWSFGRRHHLLHTYDMLPMRYRPNTHGEVVQQTWIPDLARGLELQHLPFCQSMAIEFWTDVLNDARISPQFRQQVASSHLDTVCILSTHQQAVLQESGQ